MCLCAEIRQCGSRAHTDLLSLPCSFFSPPLSHLRRRKRLRWGEALGVEQLDHAASSSLDGVISMDGSCRYSLLPERWVVPLPVALSILTSFSGALLSNISCHLKRFAEPAERGWTSWTGADPPTHPLHTHHLPCPGSAARASWRVSDMVLLLLSLTWVQNQGTDADQRAQRVHTWAELSSARPVKRFTADMLGLIEDFL